MMWTVEIIAQTRFGPHTNPSPLSHWSHIRPKVSLKLNFYVSENVLRKTHKKIHTHTQNTQKQSSRRQSVCALVNSYSKTVAFEILKFKYNSQRQQQAFLLQAMGFYVVLYLHTPPLSCVVTQGHTYTHPNLTNESLSDNRSLSKMTSLKMCSFFH